MITLCPVESERLGWEALKEEVSQMMDLLWFAGLEHGWSQSWHSTMARQYEWEQQGLLKMGAPLAEYPEGSSKVDLVEYMVLREARDSLPGVDGPEETS